MYLKKNAREEIVFGNFKKNPGKLHCQTLIMLVVTISQ